MILADAATDENFWHTHEGTIQTVVVVGAIAAIIITAIICWTIWRIKDR